MRNPIAAIGEFWGKRNAVDEVENNYISDIINEEKQKTCNEAEYKQELEKLPDNTWICDDETKIDILAHIFNGQKMFFKNDIFNEQFSFFTSAQELIENKAAFSSPIDNSRSHILYEHFTNDTIHEFSERDRFNTNDIVAFLSEETESWLQGWKSGKIRDPESEAHSAELREQRKRDNVEEYDHESEAHSAELEEQRRESLYYQTLRNLSQEYDKNISYNPNNDLAGHDDLIAKGHLDLEKRNAILKKIDKKDYIESHLEGELLDFHRKQKREEMAELVQDMSVTDYEQLLDDGVTRDYAYYKKIIEAQRPELVDREQSKYRLDTKIDHQQQNIELAKKTGYVQGVCECVAVIGNDHTLAKKILTEMNVNRDTAKKFANPETFKTLEQGIFATKQEQTQEHTHSIKR